MNKPYCQEISDATIVEKVLSDRSVVFDVVYVDPDTATKITVACVSDNQARRLKSILDECDVTVDVP